ncbi:MAG TPA: hypothetical protein VN446_06790 [Candidatus Acidoferrum sp.]|nr:hypothetical protein [Candidatus Acidoferrum sp.]
MLPRIPAGRANHKRQLTGFLGLNFGEGAQGEAGELRDCRNLSSRAFPALSQRGGRGELAGYAAPSALYSWNGLVAVDGTDLKLDGQPVATVAPGEKQFAVVGTKLCVFPDKIYLDLTNREVKPLEASVTSRAGETATFTTAALTITSPEILGTLEVLLIDYYLEYDNPFQNTYIHNYIRQYTSVSWDDGTKTWTLTGGGKARAWTDAAVGKYVMLQKAAIPTSYVLNRQTEKTTNNGVVTVAAPFLDNNDQGVYAKILSVTRTSEGEEEGKHNKYTYYTKMTLEIHDANYANGTLTKVFSVGTPVTVTGAEAAENNIVRKPIVALTDTTITFSDGTFTAGTQTGQLTVSRVFPDLDYVCESQNRLWGVSRAENTVYASALGDPTNFYLFEGSALDSYAAAVGSEGDFTGICKYDRSVLCFKENTLHRVYGDFPAEFSVAERPMFGVKEGAAGTLVNIGSVLYYLGRDGVYAFAGNTPALVSAAFGEKRFTRGQAGAVDTFYTLSAKEAGGGWGLFVYDTRKGLWLREDDTFALSFATVDGKLHFVQGREAQDDVYGDAVVLAQAADSAEAVPWMAELAPFTEGVMARKSPSKLVLRCELGEGAWMMAELSCDNEPWRRVFTSAGTNAPTLTIPIMPRRCDSYRVRLSGEGACVIRCAERIFRVGNEGR